MPALLLLRHAKSSWDDPDLDDFDRPLAPRGRNAAPRMGAEIASCGWQPDLALVSTAARARQTWDLVLPALNGVPETVLDRHLYLAPPATILALLKGAPPPAETAIVVGHNPGMEMLALSLSGPGSDDDALRTMAEKFPTAALARFEFDGSWADLGTAKTRLTHFVRPRDLG